MHRGASSSICVHAKNWQILVCGEWYANHSQTAQHRFTVPSTHMSIWFANCLRTIRRTCVYEAHCSQRTVRIPFSANQNFSVFCTNTKRTGCAGGPFHAPGVLCSPQVHRKLINHAPNTSHTQTVQCISGALMYTRFQTTFGTPTEKQQERTYKGTTLFVIHYRLIIFTLGVTRNVQGLSKSSDGQMPIFLNNSSNSIDVDRRQNCSQRTAPWFEFCWLSSIYKCIMPMPKHLTFPSQCLL